MSAPSTQLPVRSLADSQISSGTFDENAHASAGAGLVVPIDSCRGTHLFDQFMGDDTQLLATIASTVLSFSTSAS
jgi:hypothetical protein